jgi:hypothetical protein
MPNAAISGPRRVRPVASPVSHGPPPLPLARTTPMATVPPPPPPQAVDTVHTRAQAVTVRPPRPRSRRGRWFALGLVTGAIAAVVARGEGPATLQDLREWSARTLRSLEHRSDYRPQTQASAQAPLLALAPTLVRPSRGGGAPCPVNPGPDDPCAELLAPFLAKASDAPAIPTFSIESLPRVKPQVVARRHHAHPAPAAVAQARPADGDADDDDDAQATPPPPPPKSDDALAPERVPIEQTAENDAR